ncbi:hypothetical protein [Nocardia sp. NPDC052316]|uniref:hypothetical protein n=1 Tax=Nocardia sp. NPDC052316 TaxID=3364329 RepID=UPI0037C6B13D
MCQEDGMAVVLDTGRLDPQDRAEAVAAFVREASAPSYMTHTPDSGAVEARFDAWSFGLVNIVRNCASGFRRTAKQIRGSPTPLLALTLQEMNTSLLDHAGHQWVNIPGRLFRMYIDCPDELHWRGRGATPTMIPLDRLGLPVDRIRAALAPPRRSPLHPLVAGPIAQMTAAAEELAAELGAEKIARTHNISARYLH